MPGEVAGAQVRPRQELLSHGKMDEISIPEEIISDNMSYILWERLHYVQNMLELVCLTQGNTPYFILYFNIFFLAPYIFAVQLSFRFPQFA